MLPTSKPGSLNWRERRRPRFNEDLKRNPQSGILGVFMSATTTTNEPAATPPANVSYRYITRQPGVRGGNATIEGTRIGVHDVIGLLQNDETVDTIVTRCFPNLTRAHVYECLAFYEDHRGEIDVLVARQMAPLAS